MPWALLTLEVCHGHCGFYRNVMGIVDSERNAMDIVDAIEMSRILWNPEKCHGHCGFERNVMAIIVNSRELS